MKKALSLILAAMLITTVFTACKDNNTNIEDNTNIDISDTTNTNESSELLTYAEMLTQINNIIEKQDMDKTIVMSIDNYNVSLAQYRYYYMFWLAQFAYYYGPDWTQNADMVESFNGYLENDNKMPGVIKKLSEEKGISLTQKEFDENVATTHDQIKLQYGEDADTILLDEFFITPQYLFEYKIASLLYNKPLEDFITPENEAYKAIKDETLKFYNDNDYVRAKHILIAFPEETDEAKAETKKKAEEVLKKVNAGEDFDALIAQYNEDPGMSSKPYGYYFGAGTMVAPFENATRELEIGKTSGLVETTYGYHIIKRLPIDDNDIVNSDKFVELAQAAFGEEMYKNLDSATVEKAENFDKLIQPIIDEGVAYLEEVKAQQEAVNVTEDTAE